MAAIQGKLARVRYTAATPTSSTDQAATLAADDLSVTINATGRRRWDQTAGSSAFAVALDGTPVGSSEYTILHGKGTFQFSTAHSAGTWTIDCPWLATSYLGLCQQFGVEQNVDMLDVTGFSTGASGAQWRAFRPGLSDATVTLSKIVDSTGSTGPVMIDRQALNLPFYLELILNSTDQAGYVCYGYVQSDGLNVDVGDRVGENVTFRVSGPMWYTT